MESTSLQGPRTDKQLLMDPDQHEGNLGYDDPLEAFTPDLVIQLASEANAILGAAGLPMIEAENVAAKISKFRWCPIAFEQLKISEERRDGKEGGSTCRTRGRQQK